MSKYVDRVLAELKEKMHMKPNSFRQQRKYYPLWVRL